MLKAVCHCPKDKNLGFGLDGSRQRLGDFPSLLKERINLSSSGKDDSSAPKSMYSSAQIFALSLADTRASKSIATLVKFTSLGLSLEFEIDIPADRDEMLAISAAVAVSTVAEASTGPGLGLTVGGLDNGVVCPTPTAFRASVTANVTTLVKSTMLTGSAVCCAAETLARSFEELEDGVARFVILAADLPACLADFLLGGMT